MNWMFEPRSKYWYDDETEGDSTPSSTICSEILLFPISLVFGILLVYIIPILILLCIAGYFLNQMVQHIKPKIEHRNLTNWLYIFLGITLIAIVSIIVLSGCNAPTPELPAPVEPTARPAERTSAAAIKVLVDDFKPQPYQGEAVYSFNRLEGDRGALNNSTIEWGNGQATVTIPSGNEWGGMWMSLNHPIREGLPINFSAVSPPQILPAYQSQITGITVQVSQGTPNLTFRLELKNGEDIIWKGETRLEGGFQVIHYELPALGDINQLVFVLDHASAHDFVVLNNVSFTATSQINDTATAAFVWSYGMLLNNWNPATGLVRDKAKEASGEFDAIQSTGSLALATAIAEQLGGIGHNDAVQIVNRISETLLNDIPRYHGLLPHWVKNTDGKYAIIEGTEWSSVDTVIAALGLLEAQSGLKLDTSATEQLLRDIDWNNLITEKGLSHGYSYDGNLIPYAWDVFGGESWLVQLAYASAAGQVAPLAYPAPPTANGSGFIDELAWLFAPQPIGKDHWGTDWTAYRMSAMMKQTFYYRQNYPTSCFTQLGFFGLSAGEAPVPSNVDPQNIYQAFGVGGAFGRANDGSAIGTPVIVPHYSAMLARFGSAEGIHLWDWLIENGFFSPLTNVESLTFPDPANCAPQTLQWNQLKGSWNLALQTLGWGNYLLVQKGQIPASSEAVSTNPFLRQGYALLVPSATAAVPTPTPILKTYERECEYPDEATVGQTLDRSNASEAKVHGQFGAEGNAPWSARWGDVTYNNINFANSGIFYLELRYSKNSPASTYISVYLDGEQTKRAAFMPVDQGDWDHFAWSGLISLGEIESGVHSLKFATSGQQYGVADLDRFIIFPQILAPETPTPATAASEPPPIETATIITGDQTSCEGKPLNMWGSPGTYRYQRDDGSSFTLTLKPGEAIPDMGVSGPYGSLSSPPQTEEITTALGTFQAVTTSIQRDYSIFTGRYDYIKGVYRKQEWYVCGYGLVKLISSDSGTKTPGDYSYSNSISFALVSFSPQPGN